MAGLLISPSLFVYEKQGRLFILLIFKCYFREFSYE